MEKISMEKIALNAQKAREMASAAGLLPYGKWKIALKAMRNGRGDLLQGRALAETKQKLGKLPNNVRQRILSINDRYNPGKEILVAMDKQWDSNKYERPYFTLGGHDISTRAGLSKLIAHTHPQESLTKTLRSKMTVNRVKELYLPRRQRIIDTMDLNDPKVAARLRNLDSIWDSTKNLEKMLKEPQSGMSSTDLSSAVEDIRQLGTSHDRSSIIGHGDQTEGIHTVMPDGRAKSIYFKYNK